jgi:hypothetical protein
LSAEYPGDRTADYIARLTAWREVAAPHLSWEDALNAFAEVQAAV